MTRLLTTAALVIVTALAAAFGYRLLRADAVEGIYRERLHALAASHAQLAERYNTAVRQTAVTELLVEDDSLAVRIKTAEGTVETLPTPFDPMAEIYVDYALKDGRLWIRRVFDEHTAPSGAVLVNPALADLDWDESALRFGKAVYRGGLTPGVWTITVTGSGALGLSKTDESTALAAAAPVADFEEVERELDAEISEITLADVWARLFGE